MTHKERLAAIETDLGKLISDIIMAKKSRTFDKVIKRGVLVGQLTAAESIITVVRGGYGGRVTNWFIGKNTLEISPN